MVLEGPRLYFFNYKSICLVSFHFDSFDYVTNALLNSGRNLCTEKSLNQNTYIYLFFRTSRRVAHHCIKFTRENVVQFIRKTGPKNHTNEAKRRTTHTQNTRQAHTLPKHRPRRRVIGTQSLKAPSQLRQNNSKNTLTPGWYASTYNPPKTPRDWQVSCRTRPHLRIASSKRREASVHCAQDAHAPSSDQP
jgi:hypothetical protein